jgi:hypothetical protein
MGVQADRVAPAVLVDPADRAVDQVAPAGRADRTDPWWQRAECAGGLKYVLVLCLPVGRALTTCQITCGSGKFAGR